MEIWILLTASWLSINVNYENWINTEHVLALFEDVLKESRSSKKPRGPISC